MIQPDTSSSVPVRSSAPDSTNIAAMVMGAGFENTPSSSSVEMNPSNSMISAPSVATTTGGRRSTTKPANRRKRSISPMSG